MERRSFIHCMTAAPVLLTSEGFSWEEKAKLPRVLLLGDSISIGYTPYVQELLKGKAEVMRPLLPDGKPENCEGTTKGVREIARWLGDGKWDVIHFNFGLHDLKHVQPETGANSNNSDHPLQAGPDQYEANLEEIIKKLKKTSARLIFATTTPYPAGTNPLRDEGMYEKYNELALRLMKENSIEINDLCSFILPGLSEFQQPLNVHFKEEGYKVLAEEVARKLMTYLN